MFMMAPAGNTCLSQSESSWTSDGDAGERDLDEPADDVEHERAIGAEGERTIEKASTAMWLVRVATNATEDGDVEVDGSGGGNTAPVNPPLGEAPARLPPH